MKVSIINLSLENEAAPISLEVDPDTQLGTLKSLIDVELRIPTLRQELVIDGKTNHDDNSTLQSLNVKEHDVIAVRDRQSLRGPPSPNLLQERYAAINANRQAENVELFRQIARTQAVKLINAMSHPQHLRQLEQNQPAMAQAVKNNDVEAVVDQLVRTWQSLNQGPQDSRALLAMQNPMSAEAQEYMLEQIRQQAVDENRAFACEVMPEAFGDVVMLYIRVEVNDVPVLAFVDSGAQGTIMSEACARRCGLERIVDRRYQGTATGVGSARVVGRIHLAQIKCGGVFFPASFTILENQNVDLLFGLDLLRRHQCCIDLRQQKLFLGTETSVPFLSEAEIRADHEQNMIQSLINSPTALSSAAPASGTNGPTETADQSTDTAAAARSASTGPNGSRVRQAVEALNMGGGSQQQQRRGVHTQDDLNYGGMLIEQSKVDQLVNLGFDRERVRQVLRDCRGDTEMAAARLAFG